MIISSCIHQHIRISKDLDTRILSQCTTASDQEFHLLVKYMIPRGAQKGVGSPTSTHAVYSFEDLRYYYCSCPICAGAAAALSSSSLSPPGSCRPVVLYTMISSG